MFLDALTSSLSCLLRNGGVEKNPDGGRSPDEGDGRSNEDCAVVAAEVDADVSAVVTLLAQ